MKDILPKIEHAQPKWFSAENKKMFGDLEYYGVENSGDQKFLIRKTNAWTDMFGDDLKTHFRINKVDKDFKIKGLIEQGFKTLSEAREWVKLNTYPTCSDCGNMYPGEKCPECNSEVEYNLKPGDETNEATHEYFLGVLPPIYHSNGVFQVSEPNDHNSKGFARYGTYQRTESGKFFYHGSLTKKEASKIK